MGFTLSLSGVSWVNPTTSIKETLLDWKGLFVGKKWKIVWKASPSCVCILQKNHVILVFLDPSRGNVIFTWILYLILFLIESICH